VQAMGNELAGAYFHETGDKERARDYLLRARECYHAWGASVKTSQLESKYAEILAGQEELMRYNLGSKLKAKSRFTDLTKSVISGTTSQPLTSSKISNSGSSPLTSSAICTSEHVSKNQSGVSSPGSLVV